MTEGDVNLTGQERICYKNIAIRPHAVRRRSRTKSPCVYIQRLYFRDCLWSLVKGAALL